MVGRVSLATGSATLLLCAALAGCTEDSKPQPGAPIDTGMSPAGTVVGTPGSGSSSGFGMTDETINGSVNTPTNTPPTVGASTPTGGSVAPGGDTTTGGMAGQTDTMPDDMMPDDMMPGDMMPDDMMPDDMMPDDMMPDDMMPDGMMADSDAGMPDDMMPDDMMPDDMMPDDMLPDDAEAPVVELQGGTVIGTLREDTRIFLGIPYAKPPVDELRFAPPQPAEALSGPLDAKEFGFSCPQPMGALSAPNPTSEDCLTLNVFSPAAVAADEKLPVMVFIHGGAFTSGGSAQYAEADTLSRAGGVVVVTINYRLGALGFLAHPDLDRTGAPSGNLGIRDQQLALTWVKDHIAAFGGDADNVTVFGESAGSISTCYHIFSPGSASLAEAFILESGSCIGGTLGAGNHAEALQLGQQLTDALCTSGGTVQECLADVEVEDLLAYGADAGLFGAGWGPHVDGSGGVMPANPATLLASGNYNKGSLLLGTNQNEWGLFTAIGDPAPTTIAEFNIAAQDLLGAAATLVLRLYRPTTDAGAAQAYIDLMTDLAFRCPTRTLARGAAAQGSRVYLYSFDVAPGFHALELDYVFGRDSLGMRFGSSKIDGLGTSVQNYWTQFAKNGDPNGGDEVTWPVYTATTDQHLTLDAAVSVNSGLRKEYCDYWDQLAALGSL